MPRYDDQPTHSEIESRAYPLWEMGLWAIYPSVSLMGPIAPGKDDIIPDNYGEWDEMWSLWVVNELGHEYNEAYPETIRPLTFESCWEIAESEIRHEIGQAESRWISDAYDRYREGW